MKYIKEYKDINVQDNWEEIQDEEREPFTMDEINKSHTTNKNALEYLKKLTIGKSVTIEEVYYRPHRPKVNGEITIIVKDVIRTYGTNNTFVDINGNEYEPVFDREFWVDDIVNENVDINWEDFDDEESSSTEMDTIIYNIMSYIYKHNYEDEFSYKGCRYCLYKNDGSDWGVEMYLGKGEWEDSEVDEIISDDDIDALISGKAYITTAYTKFADKFKYWLLDDLIEELKKIRYRLL